MKRPAIIVSVFAVFAFALMVEGLDAQLRGRLLNRRRANDSCCLMAQLEAMCACHASQQQNPGLGGDDDDLVWMCMIEFYCAGDPDFPTYWSVGCDEDRMTACQIAEYCADQHCGSADVIEVNRHEMQVETGCAVTCVPDPIGGATDDETESVATASGWKCLVTVRFGDGKVSVIPSTRPTRLEACCSAWQIAKNVGQFHDGVCCVCSVRSYRTDGVVAGSCACAR